MTNLTDAEMFAFRRFLGETLRGYASQGVRITDLRFAELLSRRLPALPGYVVPIQRCALIYAERPGLVHAATLSVCRALANDAAQAVAV